VVSDDSLEGPRDPASRLWWLVPAVTVVLLLAFGMLFGKPYTPPTSGSSHDPGPTGQRAAFMLLDELGYPVARSRRRPGSMVRAPVLWVIEPSSDKDAPALRDWVHAGGLLVLADSSGKLTDALRLPVKIEKVRSGSSPLPTDGEDVHRIIPGDTLVRWQGRPEEVWATCDDQPLVSFHSAGVGEICLIHRPDCFSNDSLQTADRVKADNGVLLTRLADEIERRRPGRMVFDDYFHGLRERPDFTELLLQPPTLWVTLQGLLLLLLILWREGPRFGTMRPEAPVRRRSKEEYLDAMAELLDRKADYADAYRTARTSLHRDLERELGLPHDAPIAEIARLVERLRPDLGPAWGGRVERLLTANAPPGGSGKAAFLAALTDLETAREDFVDGRHAR
jgi:hypothetical protein